MAPDVEVTLEANPTSVEAARFRGYRAAGVNRVSLGVQSLTTPI
jgi:coproporphyrinogen III oxidase-like Fe-S oxidoreductase